MAFFLFMFLLGNYAIFAKRGSELPAIHRLPALLRTAEGLSKGAHVFSHGVRVGYVASLTLVDLGSRGEVFSFKEAERLASHGQGIVAILNLGHDFIFYPNYRIITKHRTILTEKIIEILPGDGADWDTRALPGNAHPWPEDSNTDSSRSIAPLYLSYDEMWKFHNKAELPERGHLLRASNYDDPIYLFAAVMGENRKNLFYTFRNLHDISEKIDNGTGTLGAVINQPHIADKANGFLEQLIYLVNEVRDGVESARESSTPARLIALVIGLLWSLGQDE